MPVDRRAVDDVGYARCGRCHLRFYPDGQAPRERYDDTYFAQYRGGDYYATESLRRHEARMRLELVREAAGPEARDLLEVGSAAGFFLDEARARGWAPVGVEPAEGPAAYAREHFGLDVVGSFVEEADLAAASFDVACMWHTLEHIPAPAPALAHLREVLRPRGALVLEVPNGASVLAERTGTGWFALEPDVHVAQWNPMALSAILGRQGYVVEWVRTVPFLTYVQGAHQRLPRRVKLAWRQRKWLRDPHPWGHELLQVVAQRPP